VHCLYCCGFQRAVVVACQMIAQFERADLAADIVH
jgi:hypothetical protein